MSRITWTLVVLCLVGADETPKPKLPLGRQTTFVTGPLDKEGYVDFEAALNAHLSQGITPETNANVLLWKALGPKPEGGSGMPPEYFQILGSAAPPEEGDYFVSLSAFLRNREVPEEQRMALLEQQTEAAKAPWSAADYPVLADWLKANEKPLAVVLEATRRPEYFNPMVSSRVEGRSSGLLSCLLPNVQKNREVAAALAARAMLRVAEGKVDDAWRDLLTCHRLARLVSRGSCLIEWLVGVALEQVACRADLAWLQAARLPAPAIQARLKELQALPPLALVADKVDWFERMVCLEVYQSVRRDGPGVLADLDGNKRGGPKASREAMEIRDSLDWGPGLRDLEGWYDRMVAALRLEDRRRQTEALAALDRELKALKPTRPGGTQVLNLLLAKGPPEASFGRKMTETLVPRLAPAYFKIRDASDRVGQTQRNLHVAFALAAHHADQKRYPAKLTELTPKYLPAVPTDIFSGADLRYQLSEKGYLLYSVGPNGVDEQGRGPGDDPPGDDLTVRVPLPERKKE